MKVFLNFFSAMGTFFRFNRHNLSKSQYGISKSENKIIWLSKNLQLNTLMKLLTILDSRLRWNDKFLQSVPPLPVIPAKAGIQELIDNLSIVDKQIKLLEKNILALRITTIYCK